MSRPRKPPPLEHYLNQVCRRLWLLTPRERQETREELRQHLWALAAHAARFAEPQEALEEAMKKFGDPKQIGSELSRQHLRRRRWLSALLKTTLGLSLALITGILGYSAYWYFALSRPIAQEPAAPAPAASAASMLVAIEAAQDRYARAIQSVRFQSQQPVTACYEGHPEQVVTHTYQVASKGDFTYSRDTADNNFGSGPGGTSHEDDVWISDGKTQRENLTEWNDHAGKAFPSHRRSARVYLRDIRFKPHSGDEMLRYGYKVSGVWIADILRRGHPVVEGIVPSTQFGPLTVVRCGSTPPDAAAEDVRLWLAPQLGWIAVKTETRQAGGRPPFGMRTVYETKQAANIGGFWMTTNGQFEYGALGLGRVQPVGQVVQRFTDIGLNNVADSLFTPHDPVGTEELSENFQKAYVLQPSGHWKEETSQFASGPSPLWLPLLASALVLGLGAVLLRAQRRRRLVA